MSHLALTGLTAVATVLANIVFAISLGSTSALINSYKGPPMLAGVFGLSAALVGLTQFAWALPAMIFLRERTWASGGIAIGTALTLLLNGLAFGLAYGVLCGGLRL